MKVVAVNGSPRPAGNTSQAIREAFAVLEAQGIETELIQVGTKPLSGCIACNHCVQAKDRRCVLKDEVVNRIVEAACQADGIILGSPVYFAGVTGTMKSVLDRVFRVASANGGLFRHKAGFALITDRRAGAVSALDQLNHYLSYAEIFQPGGNYWGVAYGMAPGEVQQDAEGLQTIRVLAANLAWLLKNKAAGADSLPPPVAKTMFNYVR